MKNRVAIAVWCVLVLALCFMLFGQTVSPPPSSGGISSCSGDINSGCSQVTGTHLASPLPAAQGGLGTAKVTVTPPTTAGTLVFGTDNATITFQGTDTYIGRATTDTLTNKTYDTAGTGNSFSINGLAVTANTGTGSVVRATSPTLVTPTLGAATVTTVNKVTLTTPAAGSTLTIADGKTLTASNTLTFTGTDSSSVNFGAGGTVSYSSGSSITSGTYASLPATCTHTSTQSDVYQANDAPYTFYCTSTNTWTAFYGSYRVTVPPALTGQATTTGNNGGSINNSATSVVVTSSSGFPSTPFVVLVQGGECWKVTNVSGTTWTITRGYGAGNSGTCNASAATVNDGTTITLQNLFWVNQGTATLTSNGTIFFNVPPQSVNFRMLCELIPSTPFSLTIGTLPGMSIANFADLGMQFRENATGKIQTLEVFGVSNTLALNYEYWSGVTTDSANLFRAAYLFPGPLWLKLKYDGTSVFAYTSPDGLNFGQIFTEAKATHFTTAPDQICFGGDVNNSTTGQFSNMTVFHYLNGT